MNIFFFWHILMQYLLRLMHDLHKQLYSRTQKFPFAIAKHNDVFMLLFCFSKVFTLCSLISFSISFSKKRITFVYVSLCQKNSKSEFNFGSTKIVNWIIKIGLDIKSVDY